MCFNGYFVREHVANMEIFSTPKNADPVVDHDFDPNPLKI
jgi:hypothetical protein